MSKITVTCLCPSCGTPVPITKTLAATVLAQDRKTHGSAKLSAWGAKGAAKRWKNKK